MSLIYRYPLTVAKNDIDVLKHVNNEVYLRWLVEAAVSHSAILGHEVENLLKTGAAFVVRRHELDYLFPAFLGEELEVETWLSTFDSTRSVREYKIIRKNDGRTILKGKTLWVYIDLTTGKPKEIPAELAASFLPYLHSPT